MIEGIPNFRQRFRELLTRRESIAGNCSKIKSQSPWQNGKPVEQNRKVTTKPGHKICSTCGKEKPFTAYYKAERTKDKLQSACKVCRLSYNKMKRNEEKKRLERQKETA